MRIIGIEIHVFFKDFYGVSIGNKGGGIKARQIQLKSEMAVHIYNVILDSIFDYVKLSINGLSIS